MDKEHVGIEYLKNGIKNLDGFINELNRGMQDIDKQIILLNQNKRDAADSIAGAKQERNGLAAAVNQLRAAAAKQDMGREETE